MNPKANTTAVWYSQDGKPASSERRYKFPALYKLRDADHRGIHGQVFSAPRLEMGWIRGGGCSAQGGDTDAELQ